MELRMTSQSMHTTLETFLKRFETCYVQFKHNQLNPQHLEKLIDIYGQFIRHPFYEQAYKAWQDEAVKTRLTQQLIAITAECVKAVEIVRARRLIKGQPMKSDYFDNIEYCISEEFRHCQLTKDDTLLLIGSGAYPMTLIQVAKETGASVIGIDIDEEAVQLGRQVVQRLAPSYDIQIYHGPVEQLARLQEVTHVMMSSTIPVKYQILDQLYHLTSKPLYVSMRYGDGFKSLFNYPSEAVDQRKWRCIDQHHRPNHIFDIVIYQKVGDLDG